MTPAQVLIWEALGCPDVDGSKGKMLEHHPAVCSITGQYAEMTAPTKKALGDNFVDQALWNAHTGRVSKPALWCCSGVGKNSPRLWSWIVAPGEQLPESTEKAPFRAPGLCATNRGNTAPIIDTLCAPPHGEWVLTVATSGQKHVLPYSKTNTGTGAWSIRMEDVTITSTPEEFRHVFQLALSLRRLGIPADAIQDGKPAYIKTAEQLQQWKELSTAIEPFRQAPLTTLALWCITKPIMENTHDYPNP